MVVSFVLLVSMEFWSATVLKPPQSKRLRCRVSVFVSTD